MISGACTNNGSKINRSWLFKKLSMANISDIFPFKDEYKSIFLGSISLISIICQLNVTVGGKQQLSVAIPNQDQVFKSDDPLLARDILVINGLRYVLFECFNTLGINNLSCWQFKRGNLLTRNPLSVNALLIILKKVRLTSLLLLMWQHEA
jgi:hypothetical protein